MVCRSDDGFYHQDERDEAMGKGCMVFVLIVALSAMLTGFVLSTSEDGSVDTEVKPKVEVQDFASVSTGSVKLEVEDVPYVWEYDETQDMQLPELPTGCEATAASTLIRKVCGVYVTKLQVADAMPKSSWDFVNCFLGDPYSESGYTCWAPCVKDTIEMFLPDGYVALDSTGTDFIDNRIPFYCYVTMDLEDPMWFSEDSVFGKGYKIAHNPHAVVVTRIDALNGVVYCVDPLKKGITEYEYDRFEDIYNQMGKQAVCIASVPVKGVDY